MQKWTDAQIAPSPIGKTINNVSAINRNGELFSVHFVFGDNTTLTIDGHHNCSLWITHGGQPNDPSSPTPAQAAASPQPEGEKGVRCSAWLGDYVTTISKNSWSTGRLLLGAIIYAIKRNEPINPFLAEAYQSILRYDLKAHEKLAALPDEYVGHQKLATLLPNPHETHEGNEPPSQNGPKETPPTVVCSPCGETVSENTEGDKSPNDPSSPTANSNAPEQVAEKSRSVQHSVSKNKEFFYPRQ